MPLRLDDEQCLLWIKDPSISPFVNDYVDREHRKNILTDEKLENPRSFINKVKNKCFSNSVLRPKIIEKIKEYQDNGTLRLFTLNDKLSDTIEYISPPFTREECAQWANNHTINPRTNLKIPISGKVYIELIYTTLQYGMLPPPILDTIPTDKYEITLYNLAKKIIKNVLYRLEFMKKNDEEFLKHDLESFDRKLKIASPLTPIRKAAAKATRKTARQAEKPNNDYGVSSSSSSYKSLNSVERRKLRDIALEDIIEKELVYKYRHKKTQQNKTKIDITIFSTFRKFSKAIIFYSKNLINTILNGVSNEAKKLLTFPVQSYIYTKYSNNTSYVQNILKNNNLDTAEGIIQHFINNMFSQLIDSSFRISSDMEITCFSFNNKNTYFKNTQLVKFLIEDVLFTYIDEYIVDNNNPSYNKTTKYIRNIITDTIPKEFVAKRNSDLRLITGTSLSFSNYQNFYYNLILSSTKEPKNIRLPKDRGLLMGKELTYAIDALEDPYFIEEYEDRVITDDNPLNGFTYEECKDWVIMPIYNPRTFKQILIDSPIYNRLLCISYQYDTNLIPRMITSRGYKIIEALTKVIDNILINAKEPPQTKKDLEEYIINKEAEYKKVKERNNISYNNIVGLKWKNIGVKKPKTGEEIINKDLKAAFIKSTNKDGELPFYILFNKEDLAKFDITDIRKDNYIEISTYYIQAINNRNKSTNNLGLRWKIINNEKYKEGIKRKGFEIINKNLKDAFLKLASKGNVLPARVSFSKEDLVKYGITTIVPNNRYIKFTCYYKPVVEKRESDISELPKPNNNVTIKKRNEDFFVKKYYTVADCLRWANQPNRDPVNPNILFNIDSEEYNIIFEQALLYDYNITPINITSKGKKFRKAILNIAKNNLKFTEHIKLPKSKGLDISEINTKVCNAIKDIYDDETTDEGKEYKKFRDKMILKCEQYNKPPSICIEKLKDYIYSEFQPTFKQGEQYKINYYQDSALASILINYDNIKRLIYKDELRNIFIHNINEFYIYIYEIDDELNEIKKDPIDAGGPKREFFTKLFEELFCDDKHLTRPFISPKDNIGNKFYINPNFAPDEKFRKVINAYKKNYSSKHKTIIEYKNEKEYKDIYFVIGKLLDITIYNEEIGLPQQFSEYILANFINPQNEIDYNDILYFYLKEFTNGIVYINMINKSQIHDLEYAELSFNDTYNISSTRSVGSTGRIEIANSNSGTKITKNNCIKFIQQQAKHAVTKNFLSKYDDKIKSAMNMKRRYDSLFAGFNNEIRKILYKNKVTINQLNLLITNEPLTYTILHELANKIVLKIEVSTYSESDPAYDPNYILTEKEKSDKENEMKGYISNIITRKRDKESVKDHFEFIKKLLQFWTALNNYNKNGQYRIFYKYGAGINVYNLPEAHTCFNELDIYGFPPDTADKKYTPEMKEDFIYKKLLLAVGEQEMVLQ